ncbi:choice-of-anchor J domain-containing protein [Winogradskyella litorisediminis]|uniref:Choice-of-anchor J domain-containing protein n=1 Tax=Winogradskyella litorisediminis TaxID=1156618 RepID=A0ABW3N493_9FLAO
MKKIVYLFALVAIALTSCNPLEDINAEVDALPDAPNVGVFEYTLTTEDYETLEVDGAFASVDEAKLLVPSLLDDLYPLYGQGSSVLVNFNLFFSGIEGVSDYTDANTYQLSNSDYNVTPNQGFGFYPNETPEDFIPTILDNQIASPESGDIVLATFVQYTEEPVVGLADVVSFDFTTTFDGWTVSDISGAQDAWTERTGYVQASGFVGGGVGAQPNVEWLISPEIDLTSETDLSIEILQEIDFINAGSQDLIDVLVSTDYTSGNAPSTATWTAISFDKLAFGSQTSTGDLDFSAYDGEEIHIAFKYESTLSESSRWRVASLSIKTLGVTGDSENLGEYYTYDGSEWELNEDVYYLSSADYDSMGEESGQPGRFDNFSDNVLPENYVPQFLEITYPFAQEGDELFVIYKYFSGGVSLRGDFYTFTNGEWLPFQASLQFGFDEGMWVPDNTIRYELVTADYELVVTELTGVAGFEAAVSNLDSFGNFSRSGGSSNWSDEMMLRAMNIILDARDPNAEEGQKYVMLAQTWQPGNEIEEFAVIKTDGVWVYQD